MRIKAYFQIQVAHRPVANARLTLPYQTQVLAGTYATGYADIKLALPHDDAPRLIRHRYAQRNAALGAAIGVFQIDQHLCVMVFSPCMRTAPLCSTCLSPEQRLEEIAVIHAVTCAKISPPELKTAIPARWRLKILPGTSAATYLIVGGTFFRILQNGIGLAELFKTCFRVGILVYIRMIFARKLAIGALDLVLRRAARHTEGLIVILEFHGNKIYGSTEYLQSYGK